MFLVRIDDADAQVQMLIDFTYFRNDVIFGLDFRGGRVWHGVLDVVETQVLMHIALIFNVMAYVVLSIIIWYWAWNVQDSFHKAVKINLLGPLSLL